MSEAFPFPPYRVTVEVKTREQVSRFGVVSRAHYHTWHYSKTRKDPDPRTGSPKPLDRLRTLTQASQTTDNCRQETMKVFSILPLLVAASLGMNLKEPVVNEVMDMVESGLGETKEGRALFITLTLTESTWSGSSSIFGQKIILHFKGRLPHQ